jgi:hypothetical protein
MLLKNLFQHNFLPQQGRPPTKYMKPACCQHHGYLSRYYILFAYTRARNRERDYFKLEFLSSFMKDLETRGAHILC